MEPLTNDPAPTTSARPLPSRRGYKVAAVLALVGALVGAVGVARGVAALERRVDAFQRVGVPGAGPVRFDRPGDFTIYYEAAGTTGDGAVTVSLPPIEVALASADTEEAVRLSAYSGSFTYSVGGHEGRAIATFHIDRPGAYTLASDATVQPGVAQLAVGRGLGSTFTRVLVPGLIAVLALFAAAILVVLTAVRRRRYRRAEAGPATP